MMTQKEYKENSCRCPVCGSIDISVAPVKPDEGSATGDVWCKTCESEWVDCYDLTGYILIENTRGDEETPDHELEEAAPIRTNLIKDALYYLDPVNGDFESNIKMARGQLNGVLTTVMALTGRNFEEAVAFIIPYLPKKVLWQAIPEPWHEEFLRQGAVCSAATYVHKVAIKSRYARMVGGAA